MPFYTNKVVLKSKTRGLEYSNVSYFIKKYVSDCSICLQFPKNSLLTECNHVFCKNCLTEMIKFSDRCPICALFVKHVFNVKLILLREVKDFICFKKVKTSYNAEYFSYPFLSIYYETPAIFKNTKLIYQSADGQPYFLCQQIVNKLNRKKHLPDMICGFIRNIKEVVVKGQENIISHKNYKNYFDVMSINVTNNTKCTTYINSDHILEGSVIYIVEIILN